MNHSDSERIAAVLDSIGYRKTRSQKEADLILVNACSVRQTAIDRIWGQAQNFTKIRGGNKNLKTILTGCVLGKDKNKFRKIFDLILDIKDLPKLPNILNTKYTKKAPSDNYLKIKPLYQSRFIAYIPIMTGCNNFCSFCVVPYTRGREISRNAKEILSEAKILIKKGYKEIWLLGQNVNSYKSKQKTKNREQLINFPKLLRIINNIPGNFWVRFTSSHPKDFSDDLIKVMAKSKKVTEYLNLPIQSGDNKILKKMNRPYTVKKYKNIIKKIRKEIPNISLSTDIIVGFPGETKKQFQNTAKLLKEIKYDMAYISQYSSRPQTAAFNLKDDIPRQEKGRRWKTLSDILADTALEKNKKYEGKVIEVLPVEEKSGFLIGKSREYKTVKFKGPEKIIGKFVKIRILKALSWGLEGEI